MTPFATTLGQPPRLAPAERPGTTRPDAYTAAELDALTRLYPTATPKAAVLAALPGRTWKSVGMQASFLGLKRPRPNAWSDDEVAVLRQHYASTGPAATAARLPGRTKANVTNKAYALGLCPCLHPKPGRPSATNAKHRPLGSKGLPAMQVGKSKPVPERPAAAPVKQSPGTPIANARVNERRRQQTGKPTPIVDLIKALPHDSPGRALYATTARAHGGPAAADALRGWLAGQAT